MIIGVTGLICAGKNAVAKMLREGYGFVPLSFGDEVRIEAAARGIEQTRINLIGLRSALKRDFGGGYWARRIIARTNTDTNYVVDGIRSRNDLQPFREVERFTLVGVTANEELRFNRYMQRQRPGDTLTREAFEEIDGIDQGTGKRVTGFESALVYEQIDHEIVNEKSKEELYTALIKFVGTIGL